MHFCHQLRSVDKSERGARQRLTAPSIYGPVRRSPEQLARCAWPRVAESPGARVDQRNVLAATRRTRWGDRSGDHDDDDDGDNGDDGLFYCARARSLTCLACPWGRPVRTWAS